VTSAAGAGDVAVVGDDVVMATSYLSVYSLNARNDNACDAKTAPQHALFSIK
jgi:hypothetical protein